MYTALTFDFRMSLPSPHPISELPFVNKSIISPVMDRDNIIILYICVCVYGTKQILVFDFRSVAAYTEEEENNE